MSALRKAADGASSALRRLHAAKTEEDAQRAHRDVIPHILELEAEEPTIGAAARATLRWMLRERAAFRRVTAAAARAT